MTNLIAAEFLRARSRGIVLALVAISSSIPVVLGSQAYRVGAHVSNPNLLVGDLETMWAFIPYLCFALGASLLGAEWTARTLPLLVAWHPKRSDVLLAKFVSALAVSAALVLIDALLLSLALVPSVLRYGLAPGAAHQWLGFAYSLLKGLGLGSAFGLFGAAVASTVRSTAGAYASAVVYVMVETFLSIASRAIRPWLVTENMYEILSQGGQVPWLRIFTYVIGACAIALIAFGRSDLRS